MGFPEIESTRDSGSPKENAAVGNKQDSTAPTTTDENTNSGPTTSGGLGEVERGSEHTGSPSGGHPQSETGDAWVLARILPTDKKDFRIKMVESGATVLVSEDIVQEAILSEISLDVNNEIRVYCGSNTGTVERMTPNQ